MYNTLYEMKREKDAILEKFYEIAGKRNRNKIALKTFIRMARQLNLKLSRLNEQIEHKRRKKGEQMTERKAWESVRDVYQKVIDSGTLNGKCVDEICTLVDKLRDNEKISKEVSQKMGDKVIGHMEDYSNYYVIPLTVESTRTRIDFCNQMITEL